MGNNNKIELNFDEIVKSLYSFHFPEVDFIVGIASGGIFPAQLIAQNLKLPFYQIHINFRLPNNQLRYDRPRLLGMDKLPEKNQRLLLVDDVSVSGETLRSAKKMLEDYDVKTFVLKGQADYVLFPEIKQCVLWPWNAIK